MAILSRFAQKLVKNGYVARFNSLKNVPVFYKVQLDDEIENYLQGFIEFDELTNDSKHVVELLNKNKVIVLNEEYDDIVMNSIKASIPKPYPGILYLILTEKCNFACDYCFIERYMDHCKANIMTKEIAKKAIDFYVKQIRCDMREFNESKDILFYGGEPLSNFEVLKYAANLINEYKQKGILPEKTTMGMVTNGTFITDDIAEELKKLEVSFSVSLDGASPQANSCRKYHNGLAGYDDIIKGLEIAKKHDCNVGLSITLSQEALAESQKVFDLIKKYDIKSIGFNILLTDKNYDVPDEYFVKASQFIIEAYKIFREGGVYEDRAMRKVNAFVEHKLHYQDCGAEGGNQLVVAPDGTIGLCQGYLSSRETFVTNVDDDSFDIQSNSLFLEWNKRTPFCMPQCEKCIALGTCGGGCAMNAKANGKTIWDLDERFCIHSKTMIEFLVWELFENIKAAASE